LYRAYQRGVSVVFGVCVDDDDEIAYT